VPVPEPGPGEVLVKVGGAGACHSDLHLLEAPAGSKSMTLPFTLGHESAIEPRACADHDRRPRTRAEAPIGIQLV
jgi:threonine dehydrogenase-like Zn-dependent dehydrogenase